MIACVTHFEQLDRRSQCRTRLRSMTFAPQPLSIPSLAERAVAHGYYRQSLPWWLH
jgi:hypothetical protein